MSFAHQRFYIYGYVVCSMSEFSIRNMFGRFHILFCICTHCYRIIQMYSMAASKRQYSPIQKSFQCLKHIWYIDLLFECIIYMLNIIITHISIFIYMSTHHQFIRALTSCWNSQQYHRCMHNAYTRRAIMRCVMCMDNNKYISHFFLYFINSEEKHTHVFAYMSMVIVRCYALILLIYLFALCRFNRDRVGIRSWYTSHSAFTQLKIFPMKYKPHTSILY